MGGCLSSAEDPNVKYRADGGTTQAAAVATLTKQNAEDAAALVTGSNAYSSWVELGISCSNLKSADTFSKSDPMAVLFKQDAGGNWVELGRTEAISNDESPNFVTKFTLLYNFEAIQNLRLEIFDVDKKHDPATCKLDTCDKLGMAEFRLSEVLTKSNRTLPLDLKETKQASSVILTGEEMSAAREILTIQLSATGLKNVEVMSKSDPFLEISRATETGQWLPVFKTEAKDNNLNPLWNVFVIRGTQLNNGDPLRPLCLRVYDFEDNGKHRLLGEAQTTGKGLKEALGGEGLPLLDGHGQPTAGKVEVRQFKVEARPSFLDYLQGGAEINFMVAIDYTASNKDPRDPQSLHYIGGPSSQTPYEEAIVGIAKVLEAYDTDKIFMSIGFGCKPPGGTAIHCLPLSADGSGACMGIAGILQAYRHTLQTMVLSGPTFFSPLLNHAVKLTQAAQQAHFSTNIKYNVLLILTDGMIHDLQETKDAIVSATDLPLSILIVGVGESPELRNMEVLDADDQKLENSQGVAAQRDIVQYVKFADFRNDGNQLARELLAELPGQFLSWAASKNIMPAPLPPPPPASNA